MDPVSSSTTSRTDMAAAALPLLNWTDDAQLENWFRELNRKTIQHLSAIQNRSLSTLVDYRFPNIDCPADTCIQVGDLFIHANYVDMPDGSKFIASQAPKTPQGQECFWKAVRLNCKVLLDLTGQYEVGEIYCPTMTLEEIRAPSPTLEDHSSGDGRLTPFDVDIFPAPSEQDHCLKRGGITVRCLKREDQFGPRLSIYTYSVIDEALEMIDPQREKIVCRIKFFEWQDFSGSSAENVEILNASVDKVLERFGPGDSRLHLGVHCRAGVGRTGTFIACRSLRNAIRTRQATPENILAKAEETLLTGRKARGQYFLQSIEQAKTLWNFIGNQFSKYKTSQ